tara:strand:+ start:3957 stop:4325 length:369 start_codon:yes stop_codon:yes gene_type:complete
VEIRLKKDGDFLKIKETLTRIGIASKKNQTLYQSCHILHKQGRYYIIHFKELFALDGKTNNFNDEDKARRNTIANLLDEWELVEILSDNTDNPVAEIGSIKILPFAEKENWTLQAKYNIGKR